MAGVARGLTEGHEAGRGEIIGDLDEMRVYSGEGYQEVFGKFKREFRAIGSVERDFYVCFSFGIFKETDVEG